MSDLHRRIFKLYMMELDGRLSDPDQRLELQAHLSTCPSCRADRGLYSQLRAQAEQRWLAAPIPAALESALRGAQRRPRLLWVTLPLRVVLWVAFGLLLLVLVQWVFTYLRPVPAVLPTAGIPPGQATPGVPPPGEVGAPGKTPVEPILHGDPYGRGMWSPEGDYFFVPLLDAPPPGGDRRFTSLHFISAATGEDCPASESFLGHQGSDQNYAWLDNERVLFIDKLGHPFLFTRCQPGSQDLSDRFEEPLLRVARSLPSPEIGTAGPMLLEAPSAYWLLDPVTLQARLLADPLTSSDIDAAYLEERALKDPIPSLMLEDSFAWLPSGHQLSVLQPIEGDLEHSHLVLLDLDTGQVLRSLEIEAYSEGMAPLVEWMDSERPFVWGFGTGGPLLVDLSVDPPLQLHAFPDLFGFDLVYPDEVFSMGAFYSTEDEGFHIVVHVNKPGDTSIYLYHSETGQVEKLDGDRQVMMVLPGDQRMPLVPLQDTPTYDDGYDLVWVDAPERPQTHLQVSGHTPRNYYILASRLLPGSTGMLFGSNQGVSLVDLLSGDTLAFWALTGAEDASFTRLMGSPNGKALIVIAHPGGSTKAEDQGALLYWIALGEPGAYSNP